jgi:hypothetical protein
VGKSFRYRRRSAASSREDAAPLSTARENRLDGLCGRVVGRSTRRPGRVRITSLVWSSGAPFVDQIRRVITTLWNIPTLSRNLRITVLRQIKRSCLTSRDPRRLGLTEIDSELLRGVTKIPNQFAYLRPRIRTKFKLETVLENPNELAYLRARKFPYRHFSRPGVVRPRLTAARRPRLSGAPPNLAWNMKVLGDTRAVAIAGRGWPPRGKAPPAHPLTRGCFTRDFPQVTPPRRTLDASRQTPTTPGVYGVATPGATPGPLPAASGCAPTC